jgi:hypothetical protein
MKLKAYFKTLSAKPRETKDVKYYYQQFTTVSRDLITKNLINKEIRYRLFIKNLLKDMITILFRFRDLDLSEKLSFLDFGKLKEYIMRMAIIEQRLDEFINDDRFQRKGINKLVNTLNGTVEQTKKLRINKAGKNDVIKKLTKGIQKLVLNTT